MPERSSQGSLLGRRVVVTRAEHQAGGLVELLEAAGADAIAVPCLAIEPASVEQREALDRALLEGWSRGSTSRWAGLIVSSPNGTEALGEALDRVGLEPGDLADACIVAIGEGTASRLRARGLHVDLVPRHARGEGLVAALRERGLLDRSWLQIRADEGRELLAEAIAEAGGQLELVVGYRTVRPKLAPALLDALRPVAAGGQGYDAICFASGRTARHFLAITSDAYGPDNARAWLALAKVVVIGPVTADAVAKLGVRVDAIAEQQSEAGLFDALRSCLADAPD